MNIEVIKNKIFPYLSKEEWRDTYKISSLSGVMIATCFNYLNILSEKKLVEKQKMKSSLNHLKVHWKLSVLSMKEDVSGNIGAVKVQAQESKGSVPEPSLN